MPVRPLPPSPSLDHLKHQAKDLLKLQAAQNPTAAQRIREFHPDFATATDAQIFATPLKLAGAQLTIAREHGFASWSRLKLRIESPTKAHRLHLPHHERIEDPLFRHAVDLMDTGQAPALRDLLHQHPSLIRQHVTFEGTNYFRNPSLLEFVAENPIRHRTMPPNVVEIATILLDAHPEQSSIDDTLGLVVSGHVAMEQKAQVPLIALLCARGAGAQAALHTATHHGYPQAVAALLNHGAHLDLPVAAYLRRMDDFRRLLPTSTPEERHRALSLASQFNLVEVARILLDAGEDPNRFNLGHSHGTPLHQAAGYGYLDLVRLLVDRGASLNTNDVLWHATPLGWAQHEGRHEVAAYLLARQSEIEALS